MAACLRSRLARLRRPNSCEGTGTWHDELRCALKNVFSHGLSWYIQVIISIELAILRGVRGKLTGASDTCAQEHVFLYIYICTYMYRNVYIYIYVYIYTCKYQEMDDVTHPRSPSEDFTSCSGDCIMIVVFHNVYHLEPPTQTGGTCFLLLLQQQQQPQLLPCSRGRLACTSHGAQELSASAALAAESAAQLGNQCKTFMTHMLCLPMQLELHQWQSTCVLHVFEGHDCRSGRRRRRRQTRRRQSAARRLGSQAGLRGGGRRGGGAADS